MTLYSFFKPKFYFLIFCYTVLFFLFAPFVVNGNSLHSSGESEEVFPYSDPLNSGKWKLVSRLSDEFEDNIFNDDKWDKWYPNFGGGSKFVFVADNVNVSDGKLNLLSTYGVPSSVTNPNMEYSTSIVKSNRTIKYGYFEIKAKPAYSNTSSSFWFAHITKKQWSEIDVFEYGVGNGYSKIYSTSCHEFYNPSNYTEFTWEEKKTHWEKPMAFGLSWYPYEQYHIYGFEWSEDYLVWYIDGKEIRRLQNTNWHQDLYLIFDSEVFLGWFGTPRLEDLPATFSIEYVRAWQKSSQRSIADYEILSYDDAVDFAVYTDSVRNLTIRGSGINDWALIGYVVPQLQNIPIVGTLTLDSTSITTTDGILNKISAKGSIIITGNQQLFDPNGFKGYTEIGGDLIFEDNPRLMLWGGDALTNIQHVYGNLKIHDAHMQVNTFKALNRVDGDFDIQNAKNSNSIYYLWDFRGMTNLQYIGGSLILKDNPRLTNFRGLDKLIYIGGDIIINHNATTMQGMDGYATNWGIVQGYIDNKIVKGNVDCSDWNNFPILFTYTGTEDLRDNSDLMFRVYVNNGALTFNYNLPEISIPVNIEVYNTQGSKAAIISNLARSQQTGDVLLPVGIYVCKLKYIYLGHSCYAKPVKVIIQ